MSLEGGKSVLQPKAFTSDVAVTTVEIGRGRPLEDSRSEFKTVPKSVDKRSEAASVGANHNVYMYICKYFHYRYSLQHSVCIFILSDAIPSVHRLLCRGS